MTIVRIQYVTSEVVVEVKDVFGDAGQIARRLRLDGLAVQRKGREVLVNGNHVPEKLKR